MKIAFLSGSLSQQKDGVGDYTQRLRRQLARRGASVFAVALNDSHIDSAEETEDTLRLPRSAGLSRNLSQAAERLARWRPDWISLQFVPYGFHPRGILRAALRAFGELDRIPARRHIMIHELWIGQSRNDSAKNKLLGLVQKRYVLALLRQLQPLRLHTSNQAYVETLGACGWAAERLPLFSNIPISHSSRDAAERVAAPILKSHLPSFDRDKAVVAVVFGSVHPEWDPTLAIDWLAVESRPLGKRLVVAFLGRGGPPAEAWTSRLSRRADIDCVTLGEQPAEIVSSTLASSDVGLATTPSALLGKSGSFLAMSEHGMPTIVVREDWIPRGRPVSRPARLPPGVYLARDLSAASLAGLLADRRAPSSNLEAVGDQMLAALDLRACDEDASEGRDSKPAP